MEDKKLRQRADLVIPNGMYGHQGTRFLPSNWPQFYQKAKGCHLWDLDGRKYTDLLCAYGPIILGYGNQTVDKAVQNQMLDLDTGTGPSARMVELAETLVKLTHGATWCMFAKNGNDVTTLALTVARAFTGKKAILVQPQGYHGAGPVWTKGRPGVLENDTAHQINYEYNNPF